MIKYDDEKIQGYIEVPHFLLKNNPQRNLVVFPADGGDHFLKHGIVKDTILFFDTLRKEKCPALSVKTKTPQKNSNLPTQTWI